MSHCKKPSKSYSTAWLCMISLMLICLCTFTSCGDSGEKANILPPEVQNMADTMFARKRRIKKKLLDSLCVLETPNLLIEVRDSIVNVERAQIEKIIGNE